MILISRILTFVTRPLMIGVLVASLLSGTYIKGRVDGYHSAEIELLKDNNNQLVKVLEDNKVSINRDVVRLTEENRRLRQLNNSLNKNLETIRNELPEEDSNCDYPAGSTGVLRNSIEAANSSVEG